MKNLPKMNLSSTGWALEQSQKPEIQFGSPIAWQRLKYLRYQLLHARKNSSRKVGSEVERSLEPGTLMSAEVVPTGDMTAVPDTHT